MSPNRNDLTITSIFNQSNPFFFRDIKILIRVSSTRGTNETTNQGATGPKKLKQEQQKKKRPLKTPIQPPEHYYQTEKRLKTQSP
jgi:hypothetical protein